jgi:hypothetical protein
MLHQSKAVPIAESQASGKNFESKLRRCPRGGQRRNRIA